jgi:short-subunit dehydrogenase
MTMKPLTDKEVLLTGASRGLGVDMARRFAKEGSRLALAARSAGELEQVRSELEAGGAQAIAVPTDVSDLQSLQALVKEVESLLGQVDVLVNNAGLEDPLDYEITPPETMERIVQVNVTGTMWLTRLVVPSMIERHSGHIVNISSVAGITPVPHNAVYSATKHAIVGLSRSLRIELAEHGIGVSVVCPGFVRGGMFARSGLDAPKTAGSVSMEQVADAVVGAVLGNKGEVIVARGLAKISDWSFAMAPELSASLMRRTGVAAFLDDLAKRNAGKQS